MKARVAKQQRDAGALERKARGKCCSAPPHATFRSGELVALVRWHLCGRGPEPMDRRAFFDG